MNSKTQSAIEKYCTHDNSLYNRMMAEHGLAQQQIDVSVYNKDKYLSLYHTDTILLGDVQSEDGYYYTEVSIQMVELSLLNNYSHSSVAYIKTFEQFKHLVKRDTVLYVTEECVIILPRILNEGGIIEVQYPIEPHIFPVLAYCVIGSGRKKTPLV